MTMQSNCKECRKLFAAKNHFFEYCPECSERKRREWERQQIQQEEAGRQARIQKRIEKAVPERFISAHLKDLSPELRHIMLNLPSERGIFMFGDTGTGKTHSMCALIKHYLMQGL